MAFVFALGLLGSKAMAGDADFDEEAPISATVAAPGKLNRRGFAGGRDDQDLQVQASLPVPSRAIDGAAQLAIPGRDEGDSHD